MITKVMQECVSSLNKNDHGVHLRGFIDKRLSYAVIDKIFKESIISDEISIYINSRGGVVESIFWMIKELQKITNNRLHNPATITTYARNKAHSGGFLIFLMGEERVVNPRSSLFMHAPIESNPLAPHPYSQLKKDKDFITDFIQQRTKLEHEFIVRNFIMEERFLSAEEALKLGIATKLEE